MLHQEDTFWRASFDAVKSDPDNFDLWEQLIEHTERVQNAAISILDPLIKSAAGARTSSSSHLNDKGLPASIPSGPAGPAATGGHHNHHHTQQKQQRKKKGSDKDGNWSATTALLNWDPLKDQNLPASYTAIKTVTREVYDMFLERFPLLFGYWTKYAEWELVFSNQLKELVGESYTNPANGSKHETTEGDDADEDEQIEKWNTLLNVPQKALDVHERAVHAFSLSIDLWTSYTAFLVSGLADRVSKYTKLPGSENDEQRGAREILEKNALLVRSVFERASAAVGRDFLADPFWDAYLAFEESYEPYLKPNSITIKKEEEEDSLQSVSKRVVHLLSKIVRIPLHQYARYYEKFTTDAKSLFLEIGKQHESAPTDMSNIYLNGKEASNVLRPAEIEYLNKRSGVAQQPAAPTRGRKASTSKKGKSAKKLATEDATDVSISAQTVLDYFANVIFARTQAGTTDRWTYESLITRPYFHVLELEQDQLDNWSLYISWEQNEYKRVQELYQSKRAGNADAVMADTEEAQSWDFVDESSVTEAFDQVRTLYERALIPCALYDSFWLRYARWMYSQVPDTSSEDSSDGASVLKNQLVEETRNIYRRACCLYVPITRPFIRFQYALFEESLGEIARARDILKALQEATCAAVAASSGALVDIPYADEGKVSVTGMKDATKNSKPHRGRNRSKLLAGTSDESVKKENEEEEQAQDSEDSTVVDVKWRDIFAAAAQTVAGTEAAKAALKYEQEKLEQKQQRQTQSNENTTPNSTELPTVLSKLVAAADITEPFFYRVEFERRVNGPETAFYYISSLLGDLEEPKQKRAIEIFQSLGLNEATPKGPENQSSPDIQAQLLKAGISPHIEAFLVSTRAELISEIYKLADSNNTTNGVIQAFVDCVNLARDYYKDYIKASITRDTPTPAQTAGPAISSSKFWGSYFEFEVDVVKQLMRMTNDQLLLFEKSVSGEGIDNPVPVTAGKKRKRGGAAVSNSTAEISTSTDSNTATKIVIEYVEKYLDRLVDSLLSTVGIPQTTISDLVRIYIDDVLTLLFGKKQHSIPFSPSSNAPTTDEVNERLQAILLGPAAVFSDSKQSKEQHDVIISQWISNRCIELEIQLNGPISTRTLLLKKISEDGNPQTAKNLLRIAVGGY